MTGSATGTATGGRAGVGAVVGETAGIVAQVALTVLGVRFIVVDESPDEALVRLSIWCGIGTAYLVGVVIWMNVLARRRTPRPPRVRRGLDAASRVIGLITTFCSSLVGVGAAVELIILRNVAEWSGAIEAIAVWAMLVAWGLFHWGYARIYDARYHRVRDGDGPPLEFPRTADPQLVDFVYFAFTNATNFSVSDVKVLTGRMRWTVVWHTTLSFFFNGLIILLAINSLTSGDLLG